MSGEDFAQHVDTVRQRPTVLSPHAKQASQKHLTLDFHELPTEIDELRAAGQSEGGIAISDTRIGPRNFSHIVNLASRRRVWVGNDGFQ